MQQKNLTDGRVHFFHHWKKNTNSFENVFFFHLNPKKQEKFKSSCNSQAR